MSKTTFDNITRSSIWTAHNYLCFYCSQTLDWGDLQIDHIIPESLQNKQKEFDLIKNDLRLDKNFDLNEIYNLVPSHSKCNSRKSDDIFIKKTILYYLSLASKAEPKVRTEIEKLKTRKNKGLIISKLQSALSARIINTEELKRILYEAEQKSWNLKEIKLPLGIEFIDDIYDIFYFDTNFDAILDKKLMINSEDEYLELANDNNDLFKVSTLNEWKDATKKGFYPMTTYAIKMSNTFTFFEEFIEALQKAKMPKISFINDPWIKINMLEYLSPNIIYDAEGGLTEYIKEGLSIGELVRRGIIKYSISNGIFEFGLKFEGFETLFLEQFRADFNDDGIEDIFVSGWVRSIQGTMGFGFTEVLTRLSNKSLIDKDSMNSN
ncbi:HNH endonuclease signature motif containing protein [Chryseobacterium wangxinyae]|uniref:HNH endonuclease n=1 Tax=Chryseobacterium sp. CY350 TaxID=2997336 RepID=UPI00226F59D0|nr:HNH endonuclease signature motif containing protein [Chryseobacterium sp. CY350]MCY0978897.1 HNH endonuclease signature motif containing protein [Chryseobacterium sp. CY350]WBZ93726.1 HNH endonuclease signature motif containing protein [Chryseobacterium sp. CY350]